MSSVYPPCLCLAITSLTAYPQQDELLRLLLNLLTSSVTRYILADLLWDKGLIFLVLIQNQSMAVRLLAIKVAGGLSSVYSDL